MAASPQVYSTYCPQKRAVRFALRASEIRTSVRVRLPLRGSEIEGLSPFSTPPHQTPSRITTNFVRIGLISTLIFMAQVVHALGDAQLHAVGGRVVIDAALGEIGLGHKVVIPEVMGILIIDIFI